MNKWDNRFMNIAEEVATWSKDNSTCVGVVITENNRIVATGFNGVPSSIEDKDEYYQYPLKSDYVIHAEINAVLNTTKPINDNMILYTTHPPCSNCAVFLVQAGIRTIITRDRKDDFVARWEDSIVKGIKIMREGGIHIAVIN